MRAPQQQAGSFLWDPVLARQEIHPDQPEHAATRVCPPQHGGLLRAGHLRRSVCVSACRCVCDVTGLTFPVFTAGPDTKLMQNSGRTKFKRTSIDRLMNTLVLWVGHLKPLTFMPHTVTISGLDLSGLNPVSYNNVFSPNLDSADLRSKMQDI